MKAEHSPAYSIVVPLYNEQESVAQLYVKITEVMDTVGEPFEMVFVDDASKDGTFRLLSEIASADRRVTVVKLRRNFGQTAALKAGFDHSQGEIIISMDGDLQHDPAEIPLFIEKIKEGYDIVSGWRVSRTDHWLARQLPSRIANWMMAKLSRVDLHDFGTTFKAYRREILSEIHLYGELHRFIPALASLNGAKVLEVPIRNIPRPQGKSHYGLSRTFRVFFDLITIRFMLRYMLRPLHFFGPAGMLCFFSGAVILLVLFLKKILTHAQIFLQHGPLMIFGALLCLFGLQFLAVGLVGELMMRNYFEAYQKPIYRLEKLPKQSHFTEMPR